MSRKGKVKMGLGDFLGRDAAAAAQPIKGKILPSGPDPNRDPDERRGSGGRRYDDDYDGHGGRSEGADNWRRGGSGGGSGGGMDDRRGGGYDRERGGGAPDDGPWRRGPPQRPGGGGFDDRRSYDDRRGGYDDRRGGHDDRFGGHDSRRGGFDDRRGGGGYGDPPAPTAERPRLQLTSRTAPPPLPPMTPKEPASASQATTPAPKPSGPRSNPFGDAQAVDTSQRDREIEAKAEASRQSTLRRRDENPRSGGAQPKGPSFVDSGRAPGEGTNGDNPTATVGDASNASESAVGRDDQEQMSPGGENDKMDGEQHPDSGASRDSTGNAPSDTKEKSPDAPPVRPVGRWAALRKEREGGDDRYASGAGYPRRDRDDDRRGGGMGGSMEGRRRDERPFGRRDDGAYGSRMDREPVQPPAPPAGNAFAKRFGSNFDRDADRNYTRSSGMGGGGFDRRDDDRRMGTGGGGGYDRRDDDRRGGMGMGGGGGLDRRDDDRRGHGGVVDRREDARMTGSRMGRDEYMDGPNRGTNATVTDSRQPPAAKDPAPERSVEHPATVSPPSTLSKMTISDEPKEPKEPKPSASAAEDNAATEEDKEPELEAEPKPKDEEQEQELEPKEDPAEVAQASAAEAMATGKRGAELKEYVLAQEKRTTAGALLEAALEDYSTPQDMKWAEESEFGAALTALSAEMIHAQIGMIYAVVAKCHKLGFPKHSGGAVVQTMFMGMYNDDLCEEDAFLEWKDDVDNPAEGRMTAVTQTTPWFMWLESVEEEED